MRGIIWILFLSIFAGECFAGKRKTSGLEKRPLPKITDLTPGCNDNTNFCLQKCDTSWYVGNQYFLGSCSIEQKYNRLNPSCYNQYLNLAFHYLLDVISYEVLEDVKTCDPDDGGTYTLYSQDLRFNDPDYSNGSGSNKYCQENVGITTWEERSQWEKKVSDYKTACDFGLPGCNDNAFDEIMGIAYFYNEVFNAIGETEFNLENIISRDPVFEKKVLKISCEEYYGDVDPLFSGWVKPTTRKSEPNVCATGLPSDIGYSIDYSNDLIKITVNPKFSNGQCARLIDVIFWAEEDGSDVKYASSSTCSPVTFTVGYGIGNFDNVL